TPALVSLGEASYAFYLVHLLAIKTIEAALPPGDGFAAPQALAIVTGAFAVALGAAVALHRCVEVPLRRLITAPRPVRHAQARPASGLRSSASGAGSST